MIRLVEDTIDNQDINILIEWLRNYPRLTKGDITIDFEEKWSRFFGTKYSIFVNSGSSANLLVLSALKFSGELKNNKIVVPSLAWATDLSPVMQLGLQPILCDINLYNLSVDLDYLERVFKTESPSCLILVSVLGLVPEMNEILRLCQEYDVILVGDHCESFGSKLDNNMLGNCGEFASTYSLYFGHHLSTIEGGMICTNDDNFRDVLLMMRSHGWSRDLSKDKREIYQQDWGINDFDNLYTFYYPGFNLRSTDLQAFIGLGQLDKANTICKNRYLNFKHYQLLVKTNKLNLTQSERTFTSAFAYPFLTHNKSDCVKRLIENEIDCRPLICGSMGSQPMFIKQFGAVELLNCKEIDKCGIYVPCHDKLSFEDVKRVSEILNES